LLRGALAYKYLSRFPATESERNLFLVAITDQGVHFCF
jgi:hypothetical protein